jgi:O-antigen/teichoic acid export membrane protein
MSQAVEVRPNSNRAFLSGATVLFISMTVVNAGNYLYNLILGRWLGPVAFADLSLIVTLMLMVTFVTATFQLTTAKFAAGYAAENEPANIAAMRDWLGRLAWIGGIVVMLIMAGGSTVWQQFFNTASAWPFVLLGIGIPVYFAQGVDRGILQGQTRFGLLAWSYLVEMLVRLGIGLGLVALGWSVIGATLGITLSFLGTWIVARTGVVGLGKGARMAADAQKAIKLFAWPVIIVQVSQILINNSDILIVKRFFPPERAGLYAALALIGRVVFFATWSVVTTLFPIVAQKHQKAEAHRHLLWIGLGLVLAVSAGIVGATLLFPERIVTMLFGNAYLEIAPLLWLYALATMLYALANVVVNYRLSSDSHVGTYLATVAGVVQVGLLWLFHDSLRQVVVLQIGLMGVLLAILLIWDGIIQKGSSRL